MSPVKSVPQILKKDFSIEKTVSITYWYRENRTEIFLTKFNIGFCDCLDQSSYFIRGEMS